MGCALSSDGIYVHAPVRMGEVGIENALYAEGVQESREEGDMDGGQMLSTEEGDMEDEEVEGDVEDEEVEDEEVEDGSPTSYGAVEEEGEVNVLAQEWLPTIGDGNEVFTTCTHHIHALTTYMHSLLHSYFTWTHTTSHPVNRRCDRQLYHPCPWRLAELHL